MKHRVMFKLFKSSSPNNPHPYVGAVLLGTSWYAIDAWVVEHDDGRGGKAKHFEGEIGTPQELTKRMIQAANGQVPDDLLKRLEDAPFDDVERLRQV